MWWPRCRAIQRPPRVHLFNLEPPRYPLPDLLPPPPPALLPQAFVRNLRLLGLLPTFQLSILPVCPVHRILASWQPGVFLTLASPSLRGYQMSTQIPRLPEVVAVPACPGITPLSTASWLLCCSPCPSSMPRSLSSPDTLLEPSSVTTLPEG